MIERENHGNSPLCESGKGKFISGRGSGRNRDSSPTGQFTDTHFEDSSPTELKTVHRQN